MTRWHLKGKPLKVQVEAIRREEGRDSFGYWMDTGLAKTALDLNRFIEDFGAERVSGHMIISPNHLKLNWVDQMRTWLPNIRDLPHTVWPEEPKPNDIAFVINYEALLSSGMNAARDFMKRHRGRLAVTTDESHRFKSHSSDTAKTILGRISPEARTFRELTGSPITLNVMDYWPQLRALGLLAGTNPYAFRNRYAVMGGYMGKQVKGIQREDELHGLMKDHIFRALFEDWSEDVPKAVSGVIGFEMSGKQQKLYREMAEDFWTMVGDEEISADMVITQAMKLQQIGRGFVMKDGKALPLFKDELDNPSFRALRGAIQEAPGKLLVFTIYRHTTEAVFETLNKLGIGTAVLRGGMKGEELEREKSDFNTKEGCRVLVAQTGVAKEGHTLLGNQDKLKDACTTSIFYETNYNWGDRKQAMGRNVRMGQRFQVRHLDMVGSSEDSKMVRVMQGRTEFVGSLAQALKGMPA